MKHTLESRNATFWGGFQSSLHFIDIFMRNFEIFKIGDYNGAPLQLPKSKISVFSLKYDESAKIFENLPPKMLQFCFFWYVL